MENKVNSVLNILPGQKALITSDSWFYAPDWTYSVDCGQVGFTRRGRLVAFDYGVC